MLEAGFAAPKRPPEGAGVEVVAAVAGFAAPKRPPDGAAVEGAAAEGAAVEEAGAAAGVDEAGAAEAAEAAEAAGLPKRPPPEEDEAGAGVEEAALLPRPPKRPPDGAAEAALAEDWFAGAEAVDGVPPKLNAGLGVVDDVAGARENAGFFSSALAVEEAGAEEGAAVAAAPNRGFAAC